MLRFVDSITHAELFSLCGDRDLVDARTSYRIFVGQLYRKYMSSIVWIVVSFMREETLFQKEPSKVEKGTFMKKEKFLFTPHELDETIT